MSRRGQYLRDLGCVLYLPLSEDGDMQDKISGKILVLSGDGSMVFDSSVGMYKVTTPSVVNQFVASLDNGFDSSWFPDDNFTVLQNIKRITNSSGKRIHSMWFNSSDDNEYGVLTAIFNGSTVTNRFPADVAKVGNVTDKDNAIRHCYQQGGLYSSYAEHIPYYPSNWAMVNPGNLLGKATVLSSMAVEYYISEVYIFNKALTLDEIRKIQGYN